MYVCTMQTVLQFRHDVTQMLIWDGFSWIRLASSAPVHWSRCKRDTCLVLATCPHYSGSSALEHWSQTIPVFLCHHPFIINVIVIFKGLHQKLRQAGFHCENRYNLF